VKTRKKRGKTGRKWARYGLKRVKEGANQGSTGQLLRYDTALRNHVVDFVPLRIADAPLYSWRGHMLDTSRHFIPVEQILTLLDGMYAAK